jgi:Ca2+-binding RTX toxin-like protein
MRSKLAGMATLLVAGLCVAPPGPAAEAAPATPLAGWTAVVLPLPNGAVAFDDLRDQLLVGVSASVPGIGNRLVEVDPVTGALGRSVVVVGDPSAIAVSDDGSRAYVGFKGASQIAEVDLTDFTVAQRFPLPGGRESLLAEDLEVQPGRPDVLVASLRNRCCSPRHEGVAVFEDGVPRPATTQGHTGANRLTWGPDADTLYGYNNETTEFGLRTLTVDADGIHEGPVTENRISGFGVDIEWFGGLVTGTSGQVVDPEAGALVGSYRNSGVIELEANATWFAGTGSGQGLVKYDPVTRLPVDSMSAPTGEARDLVDTGVGLAAAGPTRVVLMGPSVTGAEFELPAPPASSLRLADTTSVALDANRIVGSPDGERLYAITTPDDTQPQELVEVDARSGQRLRHLFLGGDPISLAVSDDDQLAVVGHRDAEFVTEVDLATFTVRRKVRLPDARQPVVAGDIEIPPGHADRYLVALRRLGISPPHGGVIAVRDGQVLDDRTPDHTGPSELVFTDDPAVAYGYNQYTTGFGFYTVDVDDDGARIRSEADGFLGGFHLRLVSADGFVYASDGSVIDEEVPIVTGRFPQNGLVAPYADGNRAFLVSLRRLAEVRLRDQTTVGTHPNFIATNVVDVAMAGATLAIASDGELRLVPAGEVPPAAPRRVRAHMVSGGVSVRWEPPVDDDGGPITGYRILRDGDTAGEVPASETTFLDPSGAEGDEYVVVPLTAEGEGVRSEPVVAVDDDQPPTVEILAPTPGTQVFVGERIVAEYQCRDEQGGSGVASCEGPVHPGEDVDTMTPGHHTFSVVATDDAGNRAEAEVEYDVVARRCFGRAVTVDRNLRQLPTNGPDVILGTPGDEEINGRQGDDVVCGGGGQDLLIGAEGADVLLGGADRDFLYGSDGTDRLEGGPGRDQLYGGRGNDHLSGAVADDHLEGGDGNDLLIGGADLDRCDGQGGRADVARTCERRTGIP